MVKRLTQYRTWMDGDIYLENGQFYILRNGRWRRIRNTGMYGVTGWYPNLNVLDPTDPAYIPEINGINNFVELGRISNLKKIYNKAARTIQKVVRNRLKRKKIVSHWRGTVKKSNNNWVKAQMSKDPNKVPVSKNKTNLVTWENFNNNNVGIKVTQRWGNVGRRENYLKPKTLQALAGKPWIDPKGKNNVRSMSRLATVFTHPYTRRRVYRRNLSPVVFVKNKSGTINWNAPN